MSSANIIPDSREKEEKRVEERKKCKINLNRFYSNPQGEVCYVENFNVEWKLLLYVNKNKFGVL